MPLHQADYAIASTITSTSFSATITGADGTSDSYFGDTDPGGSATGSVTVPTVQQSWTLAIDFDLSTGKVECTAGFSSSKG
ncbi:MAG TPA: hypothetical protein VMU09_09150 [Acidimicrobiales bacterium]|nr:hypothetical protein [Acidimicrobiales bacterium]